ncbi:MAG TPA: NADH-quinone oxidoreductase subunit L [Gammaproteobacteria bacterium]|nr:NADH-quinone oxidoreductase subunit L [Gammaproteobacteria bacterium]
MLDLLWLIPALPLVGFLILALSPLPKPGVAAIGVGSVGLSALLAAGVAFAFLTSPPAGHVFRETLWTWMGVAGFTPKIELYLDALSLVMMLVITGVGFLIHLYASEYMEEDEGYRRFFVYMNLFVAAMLVLVLAGDLLFLYLGWEGVGLCSYLLIGFWYRDPANGRAARKAFVVTRVGDVALAIGLFLLFTHLGTLDIQALMARARENWPIGSGLAIAAAALLLGGAVGKSAQLPLQTWLPDAMAGPTPVSALIHAATMVTAGMYLIARTHVLYSLAPPVQTAVAVIGVMTLLLAGFSALVQTDIKRILAYSTISQIAYMFLALGVGAWTAAIFHFMTHAFFKALLFLSAGAVILSLHEEHDIFKMGGLRKRLPLPFWGFLIGSAALAALPWVTAGFYSKDLILLQTWSSGAVELWVLGLLGALLTALYSFRAVFIAFFGEPRTEVVPEPKYGIRIAIPLVILSVLSVLGGFIPLPLHTALPDAAHPAGGAALTLEISAAAVSVLGVYLAYHLFLRHPHSVDELEKATANLAGRLAGTRAQAWIAEGGLRRFWYAGWGFDWLYDLLFVRPFYWVARVNRHDVVDDVYSGVAWLSRISHRLFSYTQTGRLRWYAAGIAGGSAIIVAIAVFS